MRTILHLLTSPPDELTQAILATQRAMPETSVQVLDLSATAPDYNQAVEAIFTTDSVEVS